MQRYKNTLKLNVNYGCGGDDEDEDELNFTKNVFLFSPKTIFKGRRNILIPFKSRRIREFFFFAGNFLQSKIPEGMGRECKIENT